jgi:hypothetical protein
MSNSLPAVFGEGGLTNYDPQSLTDSSLPVYRLVPYQGLTAAKAAALVNKQVG